MAGIRSGAARPWAWKISKITHLPAGAAGAGRRSTAGDNGAAAAAARARKGVFMKCVSPCENCPRAMNPALCEDKSCVRWRKWFTERWEQTRQLYGQVAGK